MAKFYTILTKVGEALHANAQITQTTVPWTHMAIGDGGGNPVVPKQEQTGLVREVTRVPITSIAPDPNNPNWMVVEAVLPNNVGGWTVRETAIMGTPGGAQCIAVGNYPDTYKPVLAEGSVREMVLRMVVAVIGAGTVNLVIDPAVAIASRGWVEAQIATSQKRGLIEIADLIETDVGEDEERAVTPKGLRSVLPRTVFAILENKSCKDPQRSGLYYASGAFDGPGHPVKFNGWIRHSAVTQNIYAFQEAFDVTGGYWRRAQNDGVWSAWVPVQNKSQVDQLINQIAQAINTLDEEKEDAILRGAADQYWAGDKTFKPAADIPVRSATQVKAGVVALAKIEDVYSGDTGKAMTPAIAKQLSALTGMVALGAAGVTDWVVPEVLKSGAKKAYVVVVGAGGGCGAFDVLSRGAAGGGSAEGLVDLTGVSTVRCTVGAGSAGVSGGASSFGSFMSASGGSAGQYGSGTFSLGGGGYGGTINRVGAVGGGPDVTYGGEGGSSPYGVGVPRSASGIPGSWPGGGAGAGSVTQPGAPGAIYIKW